MREDIEDIRKRIEKIDNEILRMMANRTAAAVEMGKRKASDSLPLRAPDVEEKVIGRYVSKAKEFGMSEDSASTIARLLIHESIEQQGLIPRPAKSKRMLIIGGNGKMGQWLCRFFASRGHKIKIYDTTENIKYPCEKDLKQGVLEAEVVIIAVPISYTPMILEEVLSYNTSALIFDVSSVKTPSAEILKKGGKIAEVCSVHPMFGPETNSIIDENVVICNCGSYSTVDKAEELFDGANITKTDLDEHDKLMAYVLGLSHATNIAFFETLNRSGKSYSELSRVASTTFKDQVETSHNVVSDNAQLYYEIQNLNPYEQEVLSSLVDSVNTIKDAARKNNKDAFTKMMNEGKEYFGGN